MASFGMPEFDMGERFDLRGQGPMTKP